MASSNTASMSFFSGSKYDFPRQVSRETSYAVAKTVSRKLLVIGTVAPLNDLEKLNIDCQILPREGVVEIHSHFRFGDLTYDYIYGRSVRLRDWHPLTNYRLRIPARELGFRDPHHPLF